jgi:uncharacterized membrane protein HdeD (DUF308 family)
MVVRTVDALIRNWGVVALRGVAAVLFGVITLLRPDLTPTALILMFGAFAVANGLFTIWSAVANRHGEPHWVMLLVSGILSIVIGILTFVMPGVTGIVLLFFIAGWAIATGIGEIATAIRLRKMISGEWLLILAGALSVASGLLLAVSPGAGALAVTLWIGAYTLVFGVLLIALASRLRSWGSAHDAPAARPSG